ncbi:MAG: MFS transporter [Archaeoglobaceae archaeon]|nr:MFS transporter [Archaeoglobaceae archaeon]MDW8127856.1 MFS transporter [Archaeoglobaceae archaeon]
MGKWTILGVSWLLFGSLVFAWYAMGTIAPILFELYKIDQTLYSFAFTLPWLIAGILAFPAGIIADKIGIRITATVGALITMLGTFLKVYTLDFTSLVLAQILVGIGLGIVLVNLPKIINAWFPPQQVGLATGIYMTALMIWLSLGLTLAPYFKSWSDINVYGGALILIALILFALIVRDAPPGVVIPKTNVIEGAKKSLSNKAIWGTALGTFIAMAGMVPFQALFTTAASIEKGIDIALAGAIVAMITWAGWIGSLVFPALSAKTGGVRLYIILLSLSFSILVYLGWVIGDILVLWVTITLAGFLAGGVIPHWMALPAYLPAVDSRMKPEWVGGSAGVINTFLCLGAFVSTPFIIAPIAISYGFTTAFAVSALLFAIQGIFAFLIPEPPRAK